MRIIFTITIICFVFCACHMPPRFNHPLLHELHKMEKTDQKWRDKYVRVTTGKHSNDSALVKETISKMAEVDSINYYKIRAIFQKYGYPNYDVVGGSGDLYFLLIVQHQDDHPGFQDSVLQAMKVQVDSGKSNAEFYAYLLDRVNVNSGKLQVYGTQAKLKSDSSGYEPLPCIDPEHLDERRKSVGLGPIAAYMESMNKEYMKPKNK